MADQTKGFQNSNINWFPGHMAKTRRRIQEILPLIDAVAEVIDARIPISSRNPDIAEIIAGKPHVILLNKCDMADKNATDRWIEYYRLRNICAIALDCKTGRGIEKFKSCIKTALADRLEYYRSRGMTGKPLRVMVVGIPNVGKSTFINRIAGKTRAKTENRPGVTRGNQWFTIDRQLELLDTPGVLWPKLDDTAVSEHLAFTGAIKDTVLDTELLAAHLLQLLSKNYSSLLIDRYGITDTYRDSYELLCQIGKKRGMVIRGGEVDTERAAAMILEEYRNCKIGNITLERVPDDA